VRKREFEVLGEELLDVWSLDIVGLLELNNLENLQTIVSIGFRIARGKTYVNRPETGSMSGSHILVHSLDSICS
jgi:hypothetical protein